MKKKYEITAEIFFSLSSFFSAMVTLCIFGFMLKLGLPVLKEGRFFELLTTMWDPDHLKFGIFPMIWGSVIVSFSSLAIAAPLSLGYASLVSVIAPARISGLLRMAVRGMTGVPTVVYGFAGVFLLVPLVRQWFDTGSGLCAFTASLMLAILISPTMILFFTDSFDAVPESYLMAVDALGGRKVQKLFYVIIPCAWRGMLTGVVLAAGRAFGDTLIALMLAGNAVAMPGSIFDSVRTLTSHIALVIAADYESIEFKSIFACGIILYLISFVLTLASRMISLSGRSGR